MRSKIASALVNATMLKALPLTADLTLEGWLVYLMNSNSTSYLFAVSPDSLSDFSEKSCADI